MLTGANLIGGVESSSNSKRFSVLSPLDCGTLPVDFAEATSSEISYAVNLAREASNYLRGEGLLVIPEFLCAFAESILKHEGILIDRAYKETGLSIEERLRPELQRAVIQIRLFSELARTGNPSDPRIVTALPSREPTPRPDIRGMRIGIGPVLVIEASNFPFAFGAFGGDCASALAAGCPVICKSHPGHPGTSELFARIFYDVADEFKVPKSIYSLLHGGAEVCQEIVMHPFLRGVGFTGSRSAGLAILNAAYRRQRPLDEISLEMGSVNPVFFFTSALKDCPKERAEVIARSVLLGGGQFCTNPGILIGSFNTDGSDFVAHLSSIIRSAVPPTMLSERIAVNFESRINALCKIPGVVKIAESQMSPDEGIKVHPALLSCDKSVFEGEASVREEVFGPATVLVDCAPELFVDVAQLFEGELTTTIHGTDRDWSTAYPLLELLQERSGRIIFNGAPTGVEICDSLNHGGPWPSAFGRFTSVGPSAINRWTRPVCFQNTPNELLPILLKKDLPEGISRVIDGNVETYSQAI